MFPPNPLAIRHFSAKGGDGQRFAVASTRGGSHLADAGCGRSGSDPLSHTCYPSPTLRSGPSQAGSRLSQHRQGNADCVTAAKFSFESGWFAVESKAIKTLTRGSQKCRNQSFLSPFLPHRWPDACRTRHRAALPVRRQVPLSLTGWTRTCWRAPLWAGWQALPLAASSWACRPAPRATDLIPACGQGHPENHGVARAACPADPVLHFCPHPGSTAATFGGKTCSRRS
jgi:hypothetical protein